MLRSIEALRGYTIQAKDGEVGKVHGFYFDDQTWVIRYLVADTGNWLVGRRVLISPLALDQPDWAAHRLPVRLTKKQVEDSPHIGTDQPVSRQMQEELHTYYGWPPYWRGATPLGGPGGLAVAQMIAGTKEKEGETEEKKGDPHLRSTREVIGYHIQARDGQVGHVEDFIADDEYWYIRYMVVDTRNWLPGKKVLVAPAWVEEVNWAEHKVFVDLLRETVKHCPEYDPSAPVNREYEVRLYDYYGRPKYWL
jgi:hypothetical protein